LGKEGELKGVKGKGYDEDYRAFPQFQICHYTTEFDITCKV